VPGVAGGQEKVPRAAKRGWINCVLGIRQLLWHSQRRRTQIGKRRGRRVTRVMGAFRATMASHTEAMTAMNYRRFGAGGRGGTR